jgi:hypothetical protein
MAATAGARTTVERGEETVDRSTVLRQIDPG